MAADEREYVAFVSARWAALFRTAYLLTGNAGLAEELLQGVLVKAYAEWRRVQAAHSPEAYVRAMLVNALVSDRRRVRFRVERPSADPPVVAVASHEDVIVDRAALWPHIAALPPRQRAVVVLRYYEDLSEREIADVLACSPGTVKSQAHDALRSLRRALSGPQPSEPQPSDAEPATSPAPTQNEEA